MRTTLRYHSPDRDVLTIEEYGDYCVINAEDGADGEQTRVVVKNPDRQAAAQALAGDEYHVVRASPIDDKFIAVERREYERLKREDETLRAEVEKLRNKRTDLGYEIDDLRKQLHDAEVQAAQPDRPEPVDPASVRVGDVVEIEADGPVHSGPVLRASPSDFIVGLPTTSHNGVAYWHDELRKEATVRVLQRPEPEPDEAAVEALAQIVSVMDGNDMLTELDPTQIARELIRRGVGVPSDG